MGLGGCVLAIFPGSSLGVVLEVDHLSIVAEDGMGALAVRDLAATAHPLWSGEVGILPADLPAASLRLVAPGGPVPVRRPLERSIQWDAGAREESVIRALAELWWEGAYRVAPTEAAKAWQVDALVVALLVERSPLVAEKWIRLAGTSPRPGRELVQPLEGTSAEVEAQRWLLWQWTQVERSGAETVLDAETRWAAFFFARRDAPSGPFLTLAESSQRLRALGRVNVRRRGEETRLWIHELPRTERRKWQDHWRTREAHLRALLSRVHPVYHRAAVALAGTMSQGDEASVFAEAFPGAWEDAEATAREIYRLLPGSGEAPVRPIPAPFPFPPWRRPPQSSLCKRSLS